MSLTVTDPSLDVSVTVKQKRMMKMDMKNSCLRSKTIDTNAKCVKSSFGAANAAGNGSTNGSKALPRPVVPKQQINSCQKQHGSGKLATEEKKATGVDQIVMRMVFVALVLLWLLAPVVALRGCAA